MGFSALSNLGSSTNPVALGNATNKGALAFVTASTAAGPTFTNPLTINAGGGEIDNNSGNANGTNNTAGELIFSGSVAGTATAGNVAVLTLGGTNLGGVFLTQESYTANNISGVISNGTSGGTLTLVKTGAGAWKLTNANTFTGGSQINQGIVEATNATAFGTGLINIAACGAGGLQLQQRHGAQQHHVERPHLRRRQRL